MTTLNPDDRTVQSELLTLALGGDIAEGDNTALAIYRGGVQIWPDLGMLLSDALAGESEKGERISPKTLADLIAQYSPADLQLLLEHIGTCDAHGVITGGEVVDNTNHGTEWTERDIATAYTYPTSGDNGRFGGVASDGQYVYAMFYDITSSRTDGSVNAYWSGTSDLTLYRYDLATGTWGRQWISNFVFPVRTGAGRRVVDITVADGVIYALAEYFYAGRSLGDPDTLDLFYRADVLAMNLSDGTRIGSRTARVHNWRTRRSGTLNLDLTFPAGIWSDGETIWVSFRASDTATTTPDQVKAYTLPALTDPDIVYSATYPTEDASKAFEFDGVHGEVSEGDGVMWVQVSNSVLAMQARSLATLERLRWADITGGGVNTSADAAQSWCVVDYNGEHYFLVSRRVSGLLGFQAYHINLDFIRLFRAGACGEIIIRGLQIRDEAPLTEAEVAEIARDAVGTAIVGVGITKSVNDPGNQITLSADRLLNLSIDAGGSLVWDTTSGAQSGSVALPSAAAGNPVSGIALEVNPSDANQSRIAITLTAPATVYRTAYFSTGGVTVQSGTTITGITLVPNPNDAGQSRLRFAFSDGSTLDAPYIRIGNPITGATLQFNPDNARQLRVSLTPSVGNAINSGWITLPATTTGGGTGAGGNPVTAVVLEANPLNVRQLRVRLTLTDVSSITSGYFTLPAATTGGVGNPVTDVAVQIDPNNSRQFRVQLTLTDGSTVTSGYLAIPEYAVSRDATLQGTGQTATPLGVRRSLFEGAGGLSIVYSSLTNRFTINSSALGTAAILTEITAIKSRLDALEA